MRAMREEERRKKFITSCGVFIMLLRVCAFALDGSRAHHGVVSPHASWS